MVYYRRSQSAGGTFFFTVNLRDRRQTFLVDHIDALRQIVRDVQNELPFTIDAMVILPEHFHAIWTLPPDDAQYTRRTRWIKARFTEHLLNSGVKIAQDARGEYAVWQRRFWEHTILDERDLQAHVDYVHINPVKHGYVKRAIDWEFSSIHRYVKEGKVSADWACEIDANDFGER